MTSRRRPRFKRKPSSSIVFGNSDLEVLQHIDEYRLLQTQHIVSLCDRGRKALRRRLRLLYDHKYLDRISPSSFNDSIIYALGDRGAEELSKSLNKSSKRIDWPAKNRSLGRGFIDHALFISDFASWLTEKCRHHGKLPLLTQRDITGTASARVRANTPFAGKWYQLSNIPDWMFSIGNNATDQQSKFYYVEADRGTMPVSSSTLKRSSIEKKMAIYLSSIRNGYHKNTFGHDNARVLWVVDTRYSGQKRLENLIEMNRRLTGGKGSRAFLFALRTPLVSSPAIDEAPIINGRGEHTSLIG